MTLEAPTDYRALHTCAECQTQIVIDVAEGSDGWAVVTRCACARYSTEDYGYGTALEARAGLCRLLAGLPIQRPGHHRYVYEHRARWYVQVRHNGARVTVGSYEEFDDAVEARNEFLRTAA